MNVADLLQAAETATPEIPAMGGKWARLYPVFQQLREKGFTRPGAVEWMSKQGAFPASEVKKGVKSFDAITLRRRSAEKSGEARNAA